MNLSVNDPILRDYQTEAFEKIIWSIGKKLNGNDLVVLPTGSGKSLVISYLASVLNEPILILQPSEEILRQNYEKLLCYVGSEKIGIYSASFNKKEVNHFTFATIGSIKVSEYFKHFKIVIIDESHLVNPKDMGSMFMSFLKEIGNPKVIGFTATPMRMATTWLDWGKPEQRQVTTVKLINRLKGFFWNRILYNKSIAELIEAGHLCKPEYLDMSGFSHDEIALNKSRSDFDLESFSKLSLTRKKNILKALEYAYANSKSTLVFCSSVSQAIDLSSCVPGSRFIEAKTPKKEREEIIKGFKNGSIKMVFNMGVLTTGFDHPAIDCIVLIRPTRSIVLYIQMLGRGLRNAVGKTSCKIIDLTGTVKTLGRVETFRIEKVDGFWDIVSEKGRWHNRELYDLNDIKATKPLHGGGVNTPSLFDSVK